MSHFLFFAGLLVALLLAAVAAAEDFDWNWRNQQVVGRNDPSVGNTSKLKEADRTALIDMIVQRLQKPMSERGYDDDRIREIASTSRVLFVDLGDGKPVVFATSLGLEGGCDGMGNCPLWIFRHTKEGYLPLLDAEAASYTLQPAEGTLSDLVLMTHVTARQSSLAVYHYAEGQYSDTGCYLANWPPPVDNQAQDPEIVPCKADESKPAKTEEAKPAEAAPTDSKAAEPTPEAPKAGEAAPAEPASAEPKPDAPKAEEAKPGDAPAQPPPADAAPAEPPKPDASPAEQPKSDDSAAAASASDTPKADEPKPDTPAQEPAPPPPLLCLKGRRELG